MEVRSGAALALFSLFTVCSAGGLLLFKRGWPELAQAFRGGDAWASPAILPATGAILYAVSFLVWLVIVTRLPLTIAYPVAIGLSLVAVTLGAVVWLGEPMTAARVAGAALVFTGIALIVR